MEDFDYWRLNDDLSIIEAALLVIGEDPGQLAPYVEKHDAQNQPRGYMAARNGIAGGLRKGLITGNLMPLDDVDWNGNVIGQIHGSTDFACSQVDVESLKQWLSNRGIPSSFFFPAVAPTTGPDYLDPKHPRYASKLAAAVSAWQAMEDENLRKTRKPIADMTAWLESRYREFGLVHKQAIKNKGGEVTHKVGDRNDGAIEQVCRVANWDGDGGAPKTPGGNLPTLRA